MFLADSTSFVGSFTIPTASVVHGWKGGVQTPFVQVDVIVVEPLGNLALPEHVRVQSAALAEYLQQETELHRY